MAIKVRDDVAAKMTPAQIAQAQRRQASSLIRRRTADLELIAVMVEHPGAAEEELTQVSRAGASIPAVEAGRDGIGRRPEVSGRQIMGVDPPGLRDRPDRQAAAP